MKLQQLLSFIRRAVDDYSMIQNGDKIAIGVSGGKDSLALLTAMKHFSAFYPNKFTLEAICIDLGFGNIDFQKIEEYCNKLELPFSIVHTQIADIVFQERKEKNPCSLCSKLRKGAFYDIAKSHGCNKAAFGHHKDDAVNTMLLSLIFEGRFSTFEPVTHLDHCGITLIRPMIYVEEADIKGFCNKYDILVLKNPCPADGGTKRQYVKDLANSINREFPDAKKRMFHAISEGLDYYSRK